MKIIQTKRVIRSSPILRLDIVDSSSGGIGTSHTHANKDFLDSMNIDSEERLLHNGNILPIPVVEEDW